MSTEGAPAPVPLAQLQTILRELQAAAGNFCRDEAEALVKRLDENLEEAAERSLRPEDQEALKQGHEALFRGAAAFANLLRQHLAANILKAIESESSSSEVRAPVTQSQRLELIEMDDMEREVLIVNLVRKLEDLCTETLSPLTLRLCHLKGVDNFRLELNPFRPDVMVRALVSAWEGFQPDKQSVRVMLGALDIDSFLPLNALYLELNKLLIARGVNRDQKYTIKRTPTTRRNPDALWTRSHVLPDEDADPAAAIAAYNALIAASAAAGLGAEGGGPLGAGAGFQFNPARFMHQVTLLLEHIGSGALAPAGAPGAAAAGVAAGAGAAGAANWAMPSAELMARLDALLAERSAQPVTGDMSEALSITSIENLREAPETLASNELDRATIEMVGRVFQFVLDDSGIPTGLKVQIARLQLPVLKAALSDRSFFVRDDHPARQFIDALARAGLYWTDDAGDFAEALTRIVDAAVEEAGASADAYARLVAQTESALTEEQARYEARIAHSIEEASRIERDEDARREVSLRIERRIAEKNVDDVLADFLRGPWREVLVAYFLEREANPLPWNDALAKTDLLIWSVEPKPTPAETNALRAALPALVTSLSQGLDRVGFTGAPRMAFMNHLMERQTQAIRRAGPVTMAAALAPSTVPPAVAADSDSAVDADAAAMESLDVGFTGGASERLTRNQWFALDLGLEEPLKYRLSWISPKRTRFVFTNRDGGETLIKPLAEVEELLASGALRPLEAAPLVTRAIESSAG